ncbi:MAG: ribonuclease H-like domain-containing protein [Candidatus Dormibacteraceae bacterium]
MAPLREIPAGFDPVATPLGTAWRRAEVIPAGSPPLGHTYLDTETIGLAGGAGTYAFSVALARPCGRDLEVLQLFLAEPGAEPALLHMLAEELAGAAGLGTYNGQSFDLPLLRTRWVMARMPGEFTHPPHEDLLHITRALFRHRLPSCGLGQVEGWLLGLDREHDLPSALVPEAYFQYLREGWSPALEPALRHNRQDAVSLHHLHARLLVRLAGRDPRMDAADWLALGRYLVRRGRRADGWRALRAAARLSEDESSARAALLLARALARRGRASAAELLLATLEERLPGVPELSIARAKLLEWRLRDRAGALRVVEGALDRLPRSHPPEDLLRRRARLRRRVTRGHLPATGL